MHTDDKKKYILVLGEGHTDKLDDIAITAEPKYSVNIPNSRKKTCLSLYDSAANSFVHAHGVKIQQFKTEESETKSHPLCLGNI